jgi:hypothetical protein
MFPPRRPPPLSPPPAVGGVNVTSVIIAGVVVGEPQPLPRRRGLSLLLQLALAVIVVVGCHSLEKREFREGESDRFDERERTTLRHLWPPLVAYLKRRLDNGHDTSNSL